MFRKVTGADKNGSAIESADPSDWGVTYAQVAGEKTLLQSREPMRLLRVERDRLLAETDWMVTAMSLCQVIGQHIDKP